MNWDWAHFKGDGYLAHLRRSAKLSGLLILSGLAMIVHMLVPFWQQPKFLRINGVVQVLQSSLAHGADDSEDTAIEPGGAVEAKLSARRSLREGLRQRVKKE